MGCFQNVDIIFAYRFTVNGGTMQSRYCLCIPQYKKIHKRHKLSGTTSMQASAATVGREVATSTETRGSLTLSAV